MSKKYYTLLATNNFGSIVLAEEMPDSMEYSVYGPFDTLDEAKADAIEYFKVDIVLAKSALRAARKFKIKKGN